MCNTCVTLHHLLFVSTEDLRWLDPAALSSLKGILSRKMWQWLTASMARAQPHKWTPFLLDASLPPKQELERWQKHSKLPASMTLPQCLGVRAVNDLKHVSPEVQLTHTRPVQQARLRWALRSCQAQPAQSQQRQQDRDGSNEREREDKRQKEFEDAKPAARAKVAAAYSKYGVSDDVHGFMKDLSQYCDKLGGEVPAKPPLFSKSWKADMLHVLRQAYLMAHPDKHNTAPVAQRAMASEAFIMLKQWLDTFHLKY